MQYFLIQRFNLAMAPPEFKKEQNPLGTDTKPTAHKPHMKLKYTENKIWVAGNECMIT